MIDVFGQALMDFYHNSFEPPLLLHNQYGPPEQIPLEKFFEKEKEFSDLGIFALEHVIGNTLDVGAAAGRVALALQNRGINVTAMDSSPGCCEIMKEIGVNNILIKNIYTYKEVRYDTIIMLMNGIGVAGSIEGLKKLLIHLKSIVRPTGQVVLDSSDISYLYEDIVSPKDSYFGELTYQYEYKQIMDDPIKWLYIDQEKLAEIADEAGWMCQIIFEDDTDAYLARLQMK